MKLMKRFTNAVVTVLVVCCMLCLSASALTTGYRYETILYLAKGVWSEDCPVSRSLKYTYVVASCNSVRPVNDDDDDDPIDPFTKIRCRMNDMYGNLMMDKKQGEYVVLTEGTGDQKIYLPEGKMDQEVACLQFRGNSDLFDAIADVSYDGL